MVTRIPQPQFVGPSPAEAQIQAQDVGSRWAQIAAKGINEGMKNYQAQQELKSRADLQAKAETSESDRLRTTLLAKDVEDAFNKAGLGNEGQVYLDKGKEIKQLFQFYANGNEDLANSLYESGAKAINSMTGSSMLQKGILGLVNPQQASAPAPASAPVAQPTQAQTAPMPGASPTAPVVAPAVSLAHPLPETPEEVTSVSGTLAQNSDMMKDFRASLIATGTKVQPTGDPTKDAKLLSDNPGTFLKYINSLDNAKKVALTNGAGGQNAASVSSATSQVKAMASVSGKAIAGHVQEAAVGGLQKIASASLGNATDDLTPKEQVGISRVIPSIQVLKDSQAYKDFIAAGGTEATAQRGAQALAQLLQSDPYALGYLRTKGAMSDKEYNEYLSGYKADAQVTKALTDAGIAKERADNADMQTAAKAYQVIATIQGMQEKLALAEKNSGIADKKSTEYLTATAYTAARQAWTTWQTDWMKQNPSPKPGAMDAAWAQEMQSPGSPTTSAQMVAAKLFAPYLGLDPSDPQTYMYLQKSYLINTPFGGIGETNPGGKVAVPGLPLSQGKGASAAPGANPGPTQAQKGGSDWSALP